MKLAKIDSASLVNQVAAQIRGVIQDRGLHAGDRLPPEPELIEQLGVSRTVVREAIGRLQTIGLVEVRRGVGTFVNDRAGLKGCVELVRSAISMSAGELRQFSELRASIECYAARQAASTAGDESDLAALESLAREAEEEGKSEEAMRECDLQFHLKLVELAGNRVMHDVVSVLQDLMLEGMIRTTPKPRDRKVSLKIHLDIVDALRRRDPDAAQAAVMAHMNLLIDRLKSQESPETASGST